MKTLIIQPRISYYNGGGEHYPMDSVVHLSRKFPTDEFVVFTSKTNLPKTKKYEWFLANINKNVQVLELELPDKYHFLYNVEAGKIRYRWDMESLAFANESIKMLNQLESKPDIIWAYYLMDFPFSVGIPTALHLLGYPRVVSEYREALLLQYTKIIPISENVAKKWNDILEMSVIKNYQVLHQGVTFKEIINESLFDEKKFNIVFIGRLMERKGIHVLLKSIKDLVVNSNISNICLHILGEGFLRKELEEYISNNALDEHVILHGQVSDIQDYLHHARFCIFPSFEGEGLMSVVLEGMYYNGTVVTTINNGNEEFIVNNESGYLIEANNQDQITEIITRLYNDPMFIEKTKIKAKQLVQDCSWKNYCENFNEICLSVIREFEMSNEA